MSPRNSSQYRALWNSMPQAVLVADVENGGFQLDFVRGDHISSAILTAEWVPLHQGWFEACFGHGLAMKDAADNPMWSDKLLSIRSFCKRGGLPLHGLASLKPFPQGHYTLERPTTNIETIGITQNLGSFAVEFGKPAASVVEWPNHGIKIWLTNKKAPAGSPVPGATNPHQAVPLISRIEVLSERFVHPTISSILLKTASFEA